MIDLNLIDPNFYDLMDRIGRDIHLNAVSSGFYDPPQTDGERIALMHSELSEALEYLRHGDPKSPHIPEFSGVEEEMADTVIRIMDYCHYKHYRLSEAIIAKHAYNKTRPHRHGGKLL